MEGDRVFKGQAGNQCSPLRGTGRWHLSLPEMAPDATRQTLAVTMCRAQAVRDAMARYPWGLEHLTPSPCTDTHLTDGDTEAGGATTLQGGTGPCWV